jgi:hypothetical protein
MGRGCRDPRAEAPYSLSRPTSFQDQALIVSNFIPAHDPPNKEIYMTFAAMYVSELSSWLHA